MWYDEHRPKDLDEYVFESPGAKQQILNWIVEPLKKPHLILVGPTGTGKTTLALLIKEALNLGNNAKFVSASVNSGIETIRGEVQTFCNIGDAPKLVILDEADRLTRDSQQALRNVFDTFQKEVRFIFTCNSANSLIPPLVGRSWVIHVDKLDKEGFAKRLERILADEEVDISDEESRNIFENIFKATYPNMRLAINQLQKATKDGRLNEVEVESIGELRERLLSIFKENPGDFNIKKIRDFICEIDESKYISVYRYLYENSEIFAPNEGEAIIKIADYLHRHKTYLLPDINILACFIELRNLIPNRK